MTKTELQNIAQAIRDNFTPYAFKCSCKGEEKTCLAVLESDTEWARMDMVNKITRYIVELDGKL